MLFQGVPTEDEVTEALFSTLRANGMFTDTHIRLTLTRGTKITSGMDPRLNRSGCTLIVLAEWKPPVYDNEKGISVITSAIRRNAPEHVDSKIHHNNLINNILAKIQANNAGADAALMLDAHGFASELNGTNIFMFRDDVLYTPHADACLPGITRGLVIQLARENGVMVREKNISLAELYNADEVFATGTMGELTPVREIDGRKIGLSEKWNGLSGLQQLFRASIPRLGTKIPEVG
jgi:branched-chain amino acid aminotransferase